MVETNESVKGEGLEIKKQCTSSSIGKVENELFRQNIGADEVSNAH